MLIKNVKQTSDRITSLLLHWKQVSVVQKTKKIDRKINIDQNKFNRIQEPAYKVDLDDISRMKKEINYIRKHWDRI